ncbi:MAG: transcription termination/antitermination NusG family protein [Rhodospirillales bacterium]
MNWYAVYTQSGKEAFAAQNLVNQGFEPYLPRYRKRRRHARRVETVLTPLFPRYLFVRMDPHLNRWRSINGTFGVSHILTDGDLPRAVPDEVIDTIRSHEDQGVVTILPPAFAKGQMVAINDGPFSDKRGIFECVDDHDRVVLLLDLMGRAVRAHLPGHAVSAA